tara:strand:+ start:417 stop:902 length:486 start_codon:yes stop_codon:yes gene_type:complete
LKLNQLFIVINGNDERLFKKDSNKTVICKEENKYFQQDCTLLQTDFKSLEDLVKARQLIKKQSSPINEIILINKDIDLNMISYQYNYEYIKNNYSILSNLIYFINLLISDFDKNLNFIFAFEKDSHYKVHVNIFNNSINNYLDRLKDDLKKSHSIIIKILN